MESNKNTSLHVGEGGSAAIKMVIYQARETKRPSIIFDCDGRHVAEYYREGKDLLIETGDVGSTGGVCLSKFIHDFMADSEDESLFIVSSGENELCKPILTSYVDLVLDELSCMPEEIKSRLVIALDGVDSLGELRSLAIGIKDAKQRGITIAIAIQSLMELRKIYGEGMAQIIVDNLHQPVEIEKYVMSQPRLYLEGN